MLGTRRLLLLLPRPSWWEIYRLRNSRAILNYNWRPHAALRTQTHFICDSNVIIQRCDTQAPTRYLHVAVVFPKLTIIGCCPVVWGCLLSVLFCFFVLSHAWVFIIVFGALCFYMSYPLTEVTSLFWAFGFRVIGRPTLFTCTAGLAVFGGVPRLTAFSACSMLSPVGYLHLIFSRKNKLRDLMLELHAHLSRSGLYFTYSVVNIMGRFDFSIEQ